MKNLKNNWYMLKIIWSASPKRVVGEAVTIALECTLHVLYDLYFMRFLIQCMEQKAAFTKVAAVIGIYYVCSLFAKLLRSYVNRNLRYRENVKIQEKMMDIIYTQARRVDLECYEDSEFYDTYTRANEEISNRTEEILTVMSESIALIFTLAGYGAAVLVYDPLILPFLLVAVVVSRLVHSKYVKYRFKRQNEAVYQRRRMEYAKRMVYLQDYAKDLRLTNIFAPVMRNFHRAADEARDIAAFYGKRAAVLRVISSMVSSLAVVLGINAFILYRYLVAEAYGLGVMTTILNASNGLNDSLANLVRLSGMMQMNGSFINNYRTFVEYEPKIRENDEGLKVSNEAGHDLELKNVSFSYKGSDKKVLEDINIRIPAGQKIALVGHNGAGKSTLVKLMMRLYDPTEGVITLDDKDIKEYQLKSYRSAFGTVFQDFKMFAATVTENVLLHPVKDKEEEERARKALEASGVWKRFAPMPKGMDTMLTREFEDDGTQLSGGEAQKLAVARVFAGDSSIAVLDEPSSALDPISEYEIFENMMKACEGKTVIFVSHRLSSATLADKVYLLERGRVIEEGSHHELMQLNEKYAQMFRMQAENYRKSAERQGE